MNDFPYKNTRFNEYNRNETYGSNGNDLTEVTENGK